MLFWLVAVVGFNLLVLVNALGWFYKLSPNIVKVTSIVIMMATVWLSLSAQREDLRREQAATAQLQTK
jgi:hypothetical protein